MGMGGGCGGRLRDLQVETRANSTALHNKTEILAPNGFRLRFPCLGIGTAVNMQRDVRFPTKKENLPETGLRDRLTSILTFFTNPDWENTAVGIYEVHSV